MKIILSFDQTFADRPDVKPFVLMRDRIRPALERRRAVFQKMYAKVMGRPEVDPVFLAAFTLLQMMTRLPDRAAVAACSYDARWRLALEISGSWKAIHPTTLVHYRKRLAESGNARLALEAELEAMRRAGFLAGHHAVRIDSTHVLGLVADLSRLECVRETLRLTLVFLEYFGGPEAWEPYRSRYSDRNPEELRNPSVELLRTTLCQAGADMRAILDRVQALGPTIAAAEPVALLQRVFTEQFEVRENNGIDQRLATPPGSVKNPHDPEAFWSTKTTLGKAGWVGYKVQVCETAPETPRQRGEPTEAVITTVIAQPATASDHGSLKPVLEAHRNNLQNSPLEVFTDAGYLSAPALKEAKVQRYEHTGPMGAPPHSGSRFGSDAFEVDIPNRRTVCPAGHVSTQCARIAETTRPIVSFYFAWPESVCADCALRGKCLSKKKVSAYRTLQVMEEHMIVQERRNLCKTAAYQKRMKRRNGVEGSHSELKRGLGMRRCRYRGLAKADVQVQFTAAACNLRRWAARLCWRARQI